LLAVKNKEFDIGMTFMPNFVKIGKLVELEWEKRQAALFIS
jgi:hypothetical protein